MVQELISPKPKKNKVWIPTIVLEFNLTTGIQRPLVQKSKREYENKEDAIKKAYERIAEYIELGYAFHKDVETLERAIWPFSSIASLKATASSKEEL
jgi:CRISPR/Cas system-associated protein Cas5 (RAMP superfamily)